nr:adenylate kinase isoenzyme 6 like hbr1 [Quercus suber]
MTLSSRMNTTATPIQSLDLSTCHADMELIIIMLAPIILSLAKSQGNAWRNAPHDARRMKAAMVAYNLCTARFTSHTAIAMLRTSPNIVVTGTPGVGKTTTCEDLAQKTGLRHLNINEVVKQHNIGETSSDAEDPHTKIVDEDRLLDVIENELEEGGQIIDWHACDLFPPSQIDLVVVLRCENGMLYDRLKVRGYGGKKLEENLDCEIMEVLLQEAREAYEPEIVVELRSEKTEDIDSNVERIETWIGNWRKDHGKEEEGVKAQGEVKDEDNPMFLHG